MEYPDSSCKDDCVARDESNKPPDIASANDSLLAYFDKTTSTLPSDCPNFIQVNLYLVLLTSIRRPLNVHHVHNLHK